MQPKGICTTCIETKHCGNERASDRQPIWFCDAFSTGELAQRTLAEVPEQAITAPIAGLGLCLNCENRSDCKLKDQPSGVWFCEEYL